MKWIIVIAVALMSMGSAADLAEIENSRGALVGALNGTLNDPIGVVQHVPGYGLHIGARSTFNQTDPQEVTEKISQLLVTLSSTVEGLDEDDWVSVYYRGDIDFQTNYELLIRVKPGQNDTLEIWLDGVKQ